MTKRRNFSDKFKAAVAHEALRGDKTVQEIAAKRQLRPKQVSTWKRQAIEGMASTSLFPSLRPPPVNQFRIPHVYLSQFMHREPSTNRSAAKQTHPQLRYSRGFAEPAVHVGEDIHSTKVPFALSCDHIKEAIETEAIYQPNGGSSQ